MNSLLLVLTAAIWGSTFIFQKTSIGKIDPYFFSALRFLLGAIMLLPIIFVLQRKHLYRVNKKNNFVFNTSYFNKLFFKKEKLIASIVAGIFIAIGINLQQVAITYTQVTKVAFITGLYIIFVPFIEFFLGKKLSVHIFFSAALSFLGFYLLSYNDELGEFGYGVILTLISTIFWALHIVYVGKYSKKFDSLSFSFLQFLVCGIFSLLMVFILQTNFSLLQISESWVEIVYSGAISVGIGFTLQIFAQKRVPSHIAAMILSLETVFAAIFEVIFLKTFLNFTEIVGTVLIFIAIMYVQLAKTTKKNKN